MAGSEAIINKIIADAELSAKEIIAKAESNAKEIIENAEKKASDYIAEEKKAAEENARLTVERRKTVAALDSKKIALKKRQELIDECFDKARERILSLDEEKYLAFIEKLCVENADDGDILVLGKEEKYITEEFVENISKKTGKKLSISEEKGDYVGGIVLRANSCDKNLTLNALLRSMREDKEKEIAKLLEVL